MSSIVLVNPPYSYSSLERTRLSSFIGTMPSLGLLSLAAVLRKEGHSVAIVESAALQLPFARTVELILQEEPKYLGLSCTTASVGQATRIARAVKEGRPGTQVVVGGPHVTAVPAETFRRYPEFDLALLGEGERSAVQLFAALEGKGDVSQVAGCVFREGGEIRITPRGNFIEPLDDLPFPAYDLLPSFPSAYRPAFLNYLRGPTASLTSSRGCPQACTFCDRSVFGNRYRYFSEDYLIEWITRLVRQYGIRHLVFGDDQFAASRARLVRICEKMAAAGLRVRWNCDARADSMDRDLLKLMKKAGCWMISYGIESGSPEILDGVRKNIDLERVEQVLRWTREAGIRAKGLFMIGFPEETEDSLARTLSFVRRAPLDEVNLSFLTPYPGTEIYRRLRGSPDLEENWERMNALHCVLKPRALTRGRVERAYPGILRRFYVRPGITFSYLSLLLRSPENCARLARGIGGILLGLGGLLPRFGRRGGRGFAQESP